MMSCRRREYLEQLQQSGWLGCGGEVSAVTEVVGVVVGKAVAGVAVRSLV